MACSLRVLSDSYRDPLTTFSSCQDPAPAQSPDVHWMGTGALRAAQIWPPASPLRSGSALGDHLQPPYEIGVRDFLAGQPGTCCPALRSQPVPHFPNLLRYRLSTLCPLTRIPSVLALSSLSFLSYCDPRVPDFSSHCTPCSPDPSRHGGNLKWVFKIAHTCLRGPGVLCGGKSGRLTGMLEPGCPFSQLFLLQILLLHRCLPFA